MADTGIKRFVLDLDTRIALAQAAQEYNVSMQYVAGCVLGVFAFHYSQRDGQTHALLAAWRESYAKQITERAARGAATRRTRQTKRRDRASKSK